MQCLSLVVEKGETRVDIVAGLAMHALFILQMINGAKLGDRWEHWKEWILWRYDAAGVASRRRKP